MAYIQEEDFPWHEGEVKMHSLLRVPTRENPTSPFLTPGAGHMLMRAPLLALGTLDGQNRPWTTILGGEPGFSRPIGQSIIGTRTMVDRKFDPVVEALVGGAQDGEVIKGGEKGKMVGGLAIDLDKRQRVKLYGRMVAGALSSEEEDEERGEMQLVVKIEQSLGNCPKYLNRKTIIPALPNPVLVSDSLPLPQKALDLLAKSDLFFVSSSHHETDFDTNHRGGPPGYVRVLSNSLEETALVWPEYSGNRLYQTLGNLQTTPLAGLVFPDFDSGDVLYVTGETEILAGKDAAAVLPRSNLAVKLHVTAARFVSQGLTFRGQPGEPSPYNPPVFYLPSEHAPPPNASTIATAKLVEKTQLTPTISRFRFHIAPTNAGGPKEPSPITWKSGQYVALSFEDELGSGYSHMRDDDPTSLNDDYLRTFTVSSAPDSNGSEFEITIRKVGVVTGFLFRQHAKAALEIPLRGFGGDFRITLDGVSESGSVGFIAGGIGITPLLPELQALDLKRVKLFWSVNFADRDLAKEVLQRHPELRQSAQIFVTGKIDEEELAKLEQVSGVKVHRKRIAREDLVNASDTSRGVERWYLCAGTAMRKSALEWLQGKNVIFEDFGY